MFTKTAKKFISYFFKIQSRTLFTESEVIQGLILRGMFCFAQNLNSNNLLH